MQELPNKSQQITSCELCKGDHPTGYCPPVVEEANYMGNQNQSYQPRPPPYQQGNQGYQPRGNNQGYQQGWRNEPSTSNRQPYQSYNQPSQPQGGSSKIEETFNQFMQMSIYTQKSMDAAIKNLETQVGQLSKQLFE